MRCAEALSACLGCSKVVRKSIARVLTVISQNQKRALREDFKGKVRSQLRPRDYKQSKASKLSPFMSALFSA